MAFKVGALGWRAGCVGLALFAAEAAYCLGAPPVTITEPETASSAVVPASATYAAFVESLIDDAKQDGVVSAEERVLILSQARRRLGAAEVAEVEARLAKLPAGPAATIGKTVVGADDAPAGEAANGNGSCCDEAGCGGLFDNNYIFSAADGWKSIVDDNDNNNFGVRTGFNMGVPVRGLEGYGIGAQFGMSYGVYDFHGRQEGAEDSAIEDQLLLTAGLFKRSNMCCGDCPDRISWGLVFDYMITDNLGEGGWEIDLGQFRGQVGYALDSCNDVGLMFSLSVGDDELGGLSNDGTEVRALDQASLYWLHKWVWGAETRAYFGVAEDPGELVFGLRGEAPISECVSLFGGAQYILPSTRGGDSGSNSSSFSEEYWLVTFGMAYYPGGNAHSKCVSGRRWMPLMPVADNGSFALEVHTDAL